MKKQSKNNIIKVDFKEYKNKKTSSENNFSDLENLIDEYLDDDTYLSGEKKQVYILRPVEYTDVQTIVNDLRAYGTVVVILKSAPFDVRKRIMDFIFGACYALGGTVNSASSDIFIVSVPSTFTAAIPYID